VLTQPTRFLLYVYVILLIGCRPAAMKVSVGNLPEGWRVGEVVPHDQIYSDPPVSPEHARIQFYGLLGDDTGHRLYSIPNNTPVEDVVWLFEVGSHGAMSYSFDAKSTVSLVAQKAEKISNIIPCRVIFADAAGLKLRFSRPLTDEEFHQIEALFSEEEMMQAGLDRYLSEWDGESPILSPIRTEGLFHFWWD